MNHSSIKLGKKSRILDSFNKSNSYNDILESAKKYFQKNEHHRDLLLNNKEQTEANKKNQILKALKKFVEESKVIIDNFTIEDIVHKLYEDIVEFSFLTKYLTNLDVEEININSWEDIEIIYSDGSKEKCKERFLNKEEAVNIIRRMLNLSGAVIDSASPIVLGHLSKNIRIAVLKYPIVDEDIGVCASIRIVNARKLSKGDFIKNNTATEEMLGFLEILIRYGVSICISGGTGSGKTTITNWILETIPEDKRIFSIESGSRELNLVKKDESGNTVNSVINTITRPSENENLNIEQEDLLAVALRFHPDVICVGEMRDKEAFSAQESARTGHTVITTVHANDCISTYKRIVSLCKKATDIDNQTILEFVTEAFPIVVYAKQLQDKTRKITEILECVINENGKVTYNSIFKYKVYENKIIEGKTVIKGSFEKVSNISKNLEERLLQNGMSFEDLKILKGEDECKI